MERTRGPFLGSLDNYHPRKAVYIQDRGFDSFEDNMIKLAINQKSGLACKLWPALLFFRLLENWMGGPKSYTETTPGPSSKVQLVQIQG